MFKPVRYHDFLIIDEGDKRGCWAVFGSVELYVEPGDDIYAKVDDWYSAEADAAHELATSIDDALAITAKHVEILNTPIDQLHCEPEAA